MDCLKKDLLTQLYSLDDLSVLEIRENKHYLNVDRIIVAPEGIFLNSDYFGLIALSNLMRDSIGTYTVGVYKSMSCVSWKMTR